MPDCRRSISPHGSVSNITRSSRRLRTGSAAFQPKSWEHGPPNWVLNRRRSLSICCCTMSRNCTGCCSERKEMSVVAFERKQDSGEWSETELNTIVAAFDVAIASGDGREWETGMTEKGDAQFYLLGPLPDQACELCVSRIGGRYILEDGSGRLLFEHRSLALVALHAKAAVRSRGVACRHVRSRCGVLSGRYDSRKGRAAARRGRRAACPVCTAACGFRLIREPIS